MNKNTIVKFNGKKIKIPFDLYLDPKKANNLEIIYNPYSKQGANLPQFATAVYDVIKGCERISPFPEKIYNKGREWFQKNFINEYYILLD